MRRPHIDYPRAGFDGWRRFLPSWRQWLALGTAGVVLLVSLFALAYVFVGIPNPNTLATANSTTFTYTDGTTVLGRDGAANRQSVTLDQIPPLTRYAVLAAEDRHFYSEPGISPTGIARALWVDLRGGDVAQGGSTITQQYAKNAYLSQQRTVTRKIKEIVIALKLSHQRSKDEILRDYLNTIYFGRGAYGIDAAARAYFGEDSSQLNASQSALLATVIRAPALYEPINHPEAAAARWHYVVNGMVAQGWLSSTRAARMRFPPSGLLPSSGGSSLAGPTGYIIRAAEAEMMQHGITEDQINLGGLHVQTTISRRAQHAAVAAVNGVVGTAPADVHTALVAVQPGTGKIRALYGGRDYQQRQLNDALQQIQPGSSFKPYTLVTALEHGIALTSRYSGRSPQSFGGTSFTNFADEQFGKIDLVTATEQSVNTVFVPLGIDAGGPTAVADTATSAGITTPLDPDTVGASLFLGGLRYGVKPVDQADAYATFAAQGVHAPAYLVQKVTDSRGHVLYQAHPHPKQVFPKDVMADTSYALQAPIRAGTGVAARLAAGRPAAGKTGTTSNNQSAWFVGYTPQLSAAVAMYQERNKQILPLRNIVGVPEVTGGTLPARIWKAFMDAALAGDPTLSFPAPAHVGQAKHVPPTPSPSPTPRSTGTPGPGGTGTPTPSSTGHPTITPRPTSTAGSPHPPITPFGSPAAVVGQASPQQRGRRR